MMENWNHVSDSHYSILPLFQYSNLCRVDILTPIPYSSFVDLP
jgi:hypothetical protein